MHNFLPRDYVAQAGLNPDTDIQIRVVPPPEMVVAQVLTGRFADGLCSVQNVPQRADFDPIPWQSMAVWMLTQMKRWVYIKGDVNYKQIAEQVSLLTDAKKQMAALDQRASAGACPKFTIMNRVFDLERAAAYADSFPIKRAAS